MTSSQEPLVIFYDLNGPKPWSPYCWNTRFVLNFKGIPYKTVKISYPDIQPTCERLFGTDFKSKGLGSTVPIIETIPSKTYPTIPEKALNDSMPIAKFLNQVFTPELGFKDLKGIEEAEKYKLMWRSLFFWVLNDVCENALKGDERSQEYFKRTREENLKHPLPQIADVLGGGEEKILEGIREFWAELRERMANEDGTGEPTYSDFKDAAPLQWVEAASPEKFEKLMGIYGDDTFVKLRKKTDKYAY